MSERHERVTSLLHELAAGFIAKEANSDPLITITRVDSSPDYKKATVYFTTIPEGREADALIFLKRCGSDLRHYIKKTSDLKIIPHLEFSIDVGERHRQNIDRIAEEIHKKDGL